MFGIKSLFLLLLACGSLASDPIEAKIQASLPLLQSKTASLSKTVGEKIVGGVEVDPPFRYPFIAALHTSNSFICGASLISSEWILTAAHCIVGFPPSSFSIHLHRHDLSNRPADEAGVVRTVSLVVVGNRYVSDDVKDDIALLKLSSPVEVEPVVLDSNGTFNVNGALAIIMGWGALRFQGPAFGTLLEADIPIFDFQDCRTIYSEVVNLESNTQLCAARPQGGVDTCQGDSGGPLLVFSNGRYVQIGVVSFGVGCAEPGIPGVYTSVYGFKNFISEVTRVGKTFSNCDSDPCGAYFCYETLSGYTCSDASALAFSLLPLLFSLFFALSFAW